MQFSKAEHLPTSAKSSTFYPQNAIMECVVIFQIDPDVMNGRCRICMDMCKSLELKTLNFNLLFSI